MSRICSESFSVAGEPGTDDLVFGYRKKEITLSVVFDLIKRPFLESGVSHRRVRYFPWVAYMALKENGSHIGIIWLL